MSPIPHRATSHAYNITTSADICVMAMIPKGSPSEIQYMNSALYRIHSSGAQSRLSVTCSSDASRTVEVEYTTDSMSESQKPENERLSATIGAAMKRARKSLRLTQEQASELIGITPEFYARMERGRALPSVETFDRLVECLQVEADLLLGLIPGPGEPRPPKEPQPGGDLPTDTPPLRRLLRQLRKSDDDIVIVVGDFLTSIEKLNKKRQRKRPHEPSLTRAILVDMAPRPGSSSGTSSASKSTEARGEKQDTHRANEPKDVKKDRVGRSESKPSDPLQAPVHPKPPSSGK